ncbi:MAG: alpha-L-arabinofuranosidase C-terminal domain-containing protein, partial [Silvibacterium sp.]
VTRQSQNHTLYIKLVNTSSDPQPVSIMLDGAIIVAKVADVVTLSAKTLAATNSIDHPKNIIPIESRFDGVSGQFTYAIPSYSIQVLRLQAN